MKAPLFFFTFAFYIFNFAFPVVAHFFLLALQSGVQPGGLPRDKFRLLPVILIGMNLALTVRREFGLSNESERVETETFGLPAGTMLIQTRIYPYEMAMARVDGQLKILGVYPDIDGD